MEFLMWLIEKIITTLIYPITYFLSFFEESKENGKTWQIIFALIVTILAELAIFGVLIAGGIYLFANHVEYVCILSAIIGMFIWAKSKMDKTAQVTAIQTAQQQATVTQAQADLDRYAQKWYRTMTNIVYQVVTENALYIGGITPRLVQNIETPWHYTITNGICFYQYIVYKENIQMRYTKDDLEEFVRILQAALSRMIQSGCFPTLQAHICTDNWGNIYDFVIVDTIEDIDNVLVVHTTFYSDAYAEYRRQIQMNQQATDSTIPNATWNDSV